MSESGAPRRPKKRRRPSPPPVTPPKAKARSNGKHPGGRPPVYQDNFPEIAARLCQLKMTDADMCQFFGITEKTMYRWKYEYPMFRQATDRAKELVDDVAEVSLYKRAVGYQHEAVKIFLPAGSKKPVIVPYIERFPPETAALRMWLNNRRPDRWRERMEFHDVTPPDPVSDQRRQEILRSIFSLLEEGARARLSQPQSALVDVTPPKKTNGGGTNGHGK